MSGLDSDHARRVGPGESKLAAPSVDRVVERLKLPATVEALRHTGWKTGLRFRIWVIGTEALRRPVEPSKSCHHDPCALVTPSAVSVSNTSTAMSAAVIGVVIGPFLPCAGRSTRYSEQSSRNQGVIGSQNMWSRNPPCSRRTGSPLPIFSTNTLMLCRPYASGSALGSV